MFWSAAVSVRARRDLFRRHLVPRHPVVEEYNPGISISSHVFVCRLRHGSGFLLPDLVLHPDYYNPVAYYKICIAAMEQIHSLKVVLK